MNILRTGALLLAGGLVLAGCSNTPVAMSAPGATSTTSQASTTMSKAAPAPAPVQDSGGSSKPVASPTVTSTAMAPHLDPNSRIYRERSIYFAFDDFTVSSADAKSMIELHGKYLSAKPSLAIKIEGNADERGSAEYNLALGQKRAEAVAKALVLYGVKDAQMEAVSWGKERPKATGHDETAWAENWRADLVYPKQ